MEYYKIDGKEYTSINAFSKEFGISHGTLKRNLENNCILLLEKNKRKYIEKELFLDAIKESKQIIGFREIIEDLVEKLKSNLDSKNYAQLSKLYTFISGNNFFGIPYIKYPIYKTYDSLNFYIHKSNLKIFVEGITEYLLLYNKPYSFKLNILCDDSAFDDKKITVKFIKEYLDYIDKETMCSYVETVNFIRLTSLKDLTEYYDEEISDYIKFASKEMTKAGCINLIKLYTYMQNKVKCKSDSLIQYDDKTRKKLNTTPYDAVTYMKLAYIVFNEEYWNSHNMIHKAVINEKNAKVWLFHAIHFICAWRKEDIIEKIPRITLDRPPKQVLYDIEHGVISEEQYKMVAGEITMRVNYKPSKPNKTKSHKNSPPLRFYIPESFSSVIGMLAMVCEAHNQIEDNKYALCHIKAMDISNCNRIFGSEYNDLFDGYIMSNRRANKSYISMIFDTENELETDGYLISAFVRSHTGGINKIPDITSRYLQAKMDGYSVNEITSVLFERGVCSFIPYLFCEILMKKEFKKADIKEQTVVMKSLQMNAYDIENLLKIDDTIDINIKKKIAEIIKWANEDNLTDIIRGAIENIANGECTGKNECIYCLRKAFGKECSEKYRETCVGCGYEMYVKSFLMELQNEIKFQENSLDIALTQAEKIKRKAILEKKLYPAVYESLTIIKRVFRQDIEIFKNLFSGDDENASISIG